MLVSTTAATLGELNSVSLDDEHRATIIDLVDRTAIGPAHPVDDNAWIEQVAMASTTVPPPLGQALRSFRRDSGQDGALLVRGLPVDQSELPPTPSDLEAAEWTQTRPAVLAMLVSLGLGEVVAFREEKGGALVQGVVPVPGREHAQGNMGSVELTMHTENAFHPHRPDFVGLFCLRSDHDRTAGLRIASVRRALVHLPEHAAAVLAEPRFITEPPASFGGLDAGPETHAVLNGGPVDPTIRVDFASTRATDDEAARSMELLGEAVRNVTRVLRLEPGDVAFVDNRIALHGRTAFQPRYDGEDRWLLRTFVHLDLRRSTSSRLSGGNVLLSGGGFR